MDKIIDELNNWATEKKLEFFTFDYNDVNVEFRFCNRKTDYYVSVSVNRFDVSSIMQAIGFLSYAKECVEREMVWE